MCLEELRIKNANCKKKISSNIYHLRKTEQTLCCAHLFVLVTKVLCFS